MIVKWVARKIEEYNLFEIQYNFKYSKQNDLQKNNCISFHVGRIFSNQSTSSTISARISPNLSEKN